MFPLIKHIALVLTSSSLLSACVSASSSEELMQGDEMRFTADASTRSSITTNTNIVNRPFAVYGDMISSASDPQNSESASVIFNATKVANSSGTWSYDDVQYWMPGNTYSFVALHPVKEDGSHVDNLTTESYADNRLTLHYTHPSKTSPVNYYDTEDLLISTHRRVYESLGNPHPVAFRFRHILARLNFTVRVDPSADDPVTIHSLTMRNVGLEGTFTVKPASTDSETDDFEGGSWSVVVPSEDENNPDILFSLNNSGTEFLPAEDMTITPGLSRPLFRPYAVTAATAADRRAHPANPLFVLPQEVSTRAELEIHYSVGNSDPITASANIYGITVGAHGGIWEPGKSYGYSFTLGADEFVIYSQPTVEDWNEDEGGNYVIID